MRAALLAATALWPVLAHAQSQAQMDAIAATDTAQVTQDIGPQGESRMNGGAGVQSITLAPGDVTPGNGQTITDSQGNVWGLACSPQGEDGNGCWYGALTRNGQVLGPGYVVAVRATSSGMVAVEEAKFAGWQIEPTDPNAQLNFFANQWQYISAPPPGGGGGQTVSAPTGATSSAADTTTPGQTSDPTPTGDSSGQSCPGMTLPGAITPNGGTFMANGNTYSIDATNTDVASVNGAPINAGAYETSQLVQGSDGQIYGQSNAAANSGQWFTLQGSGGDTWWQPSSAPPVSTSASQSTTVAQSTDTTAQNRVAPTVCPQITAIQSQISAANQQMQQIMAQQAQQAQLTAQQQAASTPTAPVDSTLGSSGTQ